MFSVVSSILLVERSDRFSVLSYSILKARTGRCKNLRTSYEWVKPDKLTLT